MSDYIVASECVTLVAFDPLQPAENMQMRPINDQAPCHRTWKLPTHCKSKTGTEIQKEASTCFGFCALSKTMLTIPGLRWLGNHWPTFLSSELFLSTGTCL